MVQRASANNRGIASDGAQIANWYAGLPPCTKFLLGSTVTLTLASGLHFVNPHLMLLFWNDIWSKFQIWRLVTASLTFSLSINGIIGILMLYQHSRDLEMQEFLGRSADYAWFLIFCVLNIYIAGRCVVDEYIYTDGLLICIITLWALHRQEQIVSFWFGFKFPARYFPYVLMAIEYLLVRKSAPYSMIYGWGAAQLYYYLSVDLPAQGRVNYIPTPQLLYKLLGQSRRTSARSVSSGIATSSNPIHQTPGGGHYWGAGRRLG
ncbi:hypothetical protein GGI25_005680 [Coemansia spiralis]|uniref:Derlin n=2 Tax=Coemansia TaxID=4863 RepID=A0A9W8G447_9FUNG|nr:Der1-like family-domain-containing protein [Coemansia spiralis]KAJ1987564.1 hypothetical protein EDC05_005754 [Coemansia umbellata]KAJ2619369.1 hypothetical protein GGI26_005873 [Coemansia sp. RSA 1358]KAJ2670928.1 hypothetical protein GGI25_005680 [Coemansia spiralis]